MTLPNPIRTLESHGVQDQTDQDFAVVYENCDHRMISVKVNSEKVPYVERCVHCGWIDGMSLNWWADNVIKQSLSDRAARMAIAAETRPFQFVQSSDGEDLTLSEVLGQALGAASVAWENSALLTTGTFDSVHAKAVFEALLREVERFQRLAVKEWADLAYELYALACNVNQGNLDSQTVEWFSAFKRLQARFHELLPSAHEDAIEAPGEPE